MATYNNSGTHSREDEKAKRKIQYIDEQIDFGSEK
jgi:hypothetical protein